MEENIKLISLCVLCGTEDNNDDFVDMNINSIVLDEDTEIVIEFGEIIQELLNLKVCLPFALFGFES
jgi:hypothetical protein